MSWLNICPFDRNKALNLPRNHKELNESVVNFVCDFPLPHFESNIAHCHEGHVNHESHDCKRVIDLVVHLRLDYHEVQNDGQYVFEVEG